MSFAGKLYSSCGTEDIMRVGCCWRIPIFEAKITHGGYQTLSFFFLIMVTAPDRRRSQLFGQLHQTGFFPSKLVLKRIGECRILYDELSTMQLVA